MIQESVYNNSIWETVTYFFVPSVLFITGIVFYLVLENASKRAHERLAELELQK